MTNEDEKLAAAKDEKRLAQIVFRRRLAHELSRRIIAIGSTFPKNNSLWGDTTCIINHCHIY